MKVDKISSQSIGIRKKDHWRTLGNESIHSVEGELKDKRITVYEQFTDGVLVAKLHYLSDKVGNFIKFKLAQYKDGKKINQIIKHRKSGKVLDEII